MFQSYDRRDIFYKTSDEIEAIRAANILNCKTIAYVGSLIKPGVTGVFLDEKAYEFINDHKGIPAFKGYRGYPSTLTVSINEQVVHGIPSTREIKEGDVVSIDCGVCLNGFFGDAAYTYALQGVSKEVMKLLVITEQSLYRGIAQAIHGRRVGDIGFAVSDFCEREHKYGVVRDLVGHGVGRHLHEEPDVPNHGKRGKGIVLKEGLVIAIEPMVNMGVRDVRSLSDKWTIVTLDNKPSAHYEHSVAVKKGKADILSDHSFIKEAEKNNPNLLEISLNS